MKIWKMIASSPLAVGVIHEEMPQITQTNIYYELGVAQAMGKETVIAKSPRSEVPSDLIRNEYIEFNGEFEKKFSEFLAGLLDQAGHYEIIADKIDRNPVLALDYLKRAYLITGDHQLKEKAKTILKDAGIKDRAANSVENLVGDF